MLDSVIKVSNIKISPIEDIDDKDRVISET